MKRFSDNDIEFKARSLFNGYPIINEVSCCCRPVDGYETPKKQNQELVCDDYYGRFYTSRFLEKVKFLYGVTESLNYYNSGLRDLPEIVDELRVPYRRIPIFKVGSLNDIKELTQIMIEKNPNNVILFRGQNKLYEIERSDEEKQMLYGSVAIKEPSFLPSFQRPNQKVGYTSLCSAWHRLASILINDLNCDYKNIISPYFRSVEEFHTFALGIAQHYGLPSVGVDLTDNLETALWFAINYLNVKGDGSTSYNLIGPEAKDATIFIFRCDQRSITRYDYGLEEYADNHRPLAQNAWFHHGGWGLSRNQMALQLMCGFHVDVSWKSALPKDYFGQLFPSQKDDYFLDFFIKMQKWFEGSRIGDMLKGLYY